MIEIGSIYDSKNYGKCTVLGKDHDDYYFVQFLDTGSISSFRAKHIKTGSIRDPYAKKVCLVGCTGNLPTVGDYKPYYSIWHDMIHRCYDPNNKRFHAYRNVVVSLDWCTFSNFYADCIKLPGYDKEKVERGELVIDKDSKQRFQTLKIYSKDTCVWITKHENNKMQDGQQRRFVAVSPTGEVFNDCNITDFARVHDLERRGISAVLHGRNKTTKGWKFTYAD